MSEGGANLGARECAGYGPDPQVRRGTSGELQIVHALLAEAAHTLKESGLQFQKPDPEAVKLLVARAAQQGLLWVAEIPQVAVVGFLAATLHDDWVHIDELAVHLPHRRRGIGSSLIRACMGEAVKFDCRAVSLTTDKHLPFNAAMFQRRGFVEIDIHACPAHLRLALTRERELAPAPERRIGMVKQL